MPCSTSAAQPDSVNWLTLSARTIEPKRVSPPSVVGWPPRSRTLRQPSQTRSRSVPIQVMLSSSWVASTKPGAALVRGQGWLPWQGRGWFVAQRDRGAGGGLALPGWALGCNCGSLDASEGRRGCVLDLDRDELARRRRAGEVDGRVAARATAQALGVGAARAFDEDFLDAADALAVAPPGDALDDFHEALDPFALDLVGDVVGHRRRLGAGARRVDEREGPVVADFLDCAERLLKLGVGLAREADDQVGRQREVRDGCAELGDEPQVALPRVRAAHRLEHACRPRLQRQVRVLADGLAFRHRRDHRGAEV